jgi:hypothetical protein
LWEEAEEKHVPRLGQKQCVESVAAVLWYTRHKVINDQKHRQHSLKQRKKVTKTKRGHGKEKIMTWLFIVMTP